MIKQECIGIPDMILLLMIFCFKKIKIKAEIVLSPGGAYFHYLGFGGSVSFSALILSCGKSCKSLDKIHGVVLEHYLVVIQLIWGSRDFGSEKILMKSIIHSTPFITIFAYNGIRI